MEENNNKSKKDKKKIVIATSITILLLVLITGITYAAFDFSFIGNRNVIETGDISIEFLESNDVITLTNALPTSDSNGKVQTNDFDFQVTTRASNGISLKYDLNIEKLAVDSGYTSLNDNQVKVYLTDENNNPLVEPTLISNLSNYNLYSKVNSHTESTTEIKDRYKIRVWIDENVDSSSWNENTKIQYKFRIGVSSEEYKNGADTIIAKAGTDGLVAEEHQETEQLEATTDYRYTGANPNNYVSFNNELWRIIGVFPTEDASGKIENRVKIIRDESIGIYSWDNKPSGTGSSTSRYGSNDWSDSALQIVLNEGAYYNRTSGNCPSGRNGATTACDFTSTGLTIEAKSMIEDAKWYLGGSSSYKDVTTGMFYERERGTDVYSGRPTSFIGKIGLMYPSDYGYATSGGSTTSREECLAKELYNWDSSSYSDCKNNDWLFNGSFQWPITPHSGYSNYVFRVRSSGSVSYHYANRTYAARPVLYLDSMVEITGGTGTSSDPYTLGI